jgi:hypothetical protein
MIDVIRARFLPFSSKRLVEHNAFEKNELDGEFRGHRVTVGYGEAAAGSVPGRHTR